jgi:hypothetical protein
MKRSLTLLALLAGTTFPAFVDAAEIDWKNVDAALGKTAARTALDTTAVAKAM